MGPYLSQSHCCTSNRGRGSKRSGKNMHLKFITIKCCKLMYCVRLCTSCIWLNCLPGSPRSPPLLVRACTCWLCAAAAEEANTAAHLHEAQDALRVGQVFAHLQDTTATDNCFVNSPWELNPLPLIAMFWKCCALQCCSSAYMHASTQSRTITASTWHCCTQQ